MFEGSIVLTKSVCEPINWNKYGGWFQEASPIPLLEAVNLLKENRLQLPKLSLVGKVFRRWPFYSDITGGCGSGNGDRRLRFLLTEEMSRDPIRFYVTCFGRYAEELENASISESDVIEIWKPCITLKRWQPMEKAACRGDNICDYELWFGLEEEDINVNYEKRIVIYKLQPESIIDEGRNPKGLLSAREGNIIQNQGESNHVAPEIEANSHNNNIQESLAKTTDSAKPQPADQIRSVTDENITETTFPQIASMRSRCLPTTSEVEEYDDRVYSTINECVSVEKSVKYNLYAIVTNVTREPSPTRGSKLMSQVYITDATCQGTYGFTDFQFSLLGHSLKDFPMIVVGSIIRIHHMSIQKWQGDFNGRVYDARSVTVVGDVDSLILREKNAASKLNKRDKLMVTHLVEWWAKEGKEKQSQSQSEDVRGKGDEIMEKNALEDRDLMDSLQNALTSIEKAFEVTPSIDNIENDDDSESVNVPIFSVNSEPLVIRPCTSTDNTTSTEDENENLPQTSKRLEKQWQEKKSDLQSGRTAIPSSRKESNPMIATNVNFEALLQHENSVSASAEHCKSSKGTASQNHATKDTLADSNLPDSMQAIAGSQELPDCDDTESNINGTSTRIAASVHSPSPSTKNNFAIRSSGKFPLISSLADVKTKTAGEKFRVVGYVREFRPNILRCQNNLILLHAICTQCCTSIPLLRFGESKRSSIESDNPKTTIPSCLKCNEKLVLYFNITVVVSDIKIPQPLPMPESTDVTCEFVLSGTHAEYMFGTSAHKFFLSKDTQNQVVKNLAGAIDRRVEMSLTVVESLPRREYHIINSYLHYDNDQEYEQAVSS